MAAMLQRKVIGGLLLQGHKARVPYYCIAQFSSDDKDKQKGEMNEEPKKAGWFKSMLRVRTIEPSKHSHATQLSDKENLYEIQIHSVKPEFMESYLKQFSQFQELMHEKGTGAQLVGSWTVEVGDQDEAVHIWQYKGGYPVLNNANEIYRTDMDFIQFRINRNKMLRSRKNQIVLPFLFWPEMEPVPPRHIYEMRSYTLKPGTMIEWGNNWARGLQCRMENEKPVAGFFSQMGGDLYSVHHIWAYKDLQQRKEAREAAWAKPGWDECVAYTVPLIRLLQTRLLIPTPFSPLQ